MEGFRTEVGVAGASGLRCDGLGEFRVDAVADIEGGDGSGASCV